MRSTCAATAPVATVREFIVSSGPLASSICWRRKGSSPGLRTKEAVQKPRAASQKEPRRTFPKKKIRRRD